MDAENGSDGTWAEPYRHRAAEISAGLNNIVEVLNEIVVDHLREAVANDVTVRPQLDKDLQSARRAVEKAARILEQ